MYDVKSFVARGSTCQQYRYRIMNDGKATGNIFNNYKEAERYAALRNIRELAKKLNVAIDLEDSQLIQKIVVLD